MRVTPKCRIKRVEPLCSVKEQRRGLATATDVQCDPAAKSLGHRDLQRVHRRGCCALEDDQRRLRRSSEVLGLRRRQRSPGAPGAVGSERRRPLEEHRRRRQPATRLRSLGRALQLGGEILVSSERSLGAVPRPAIRICLRIGRFGQRTMDRLPVGQRRGTIDRRAHQRVMKPDLRSELDQADRLSRRGRFDAQPDQLRCP